MGVGDIAVGVVLHPEDNVATMLEDLEAGGEALARDRAGSIVCRVVALDDIEAGHKIALEDIDSRGLVRKYGETIGRATTSIAAGQWVHTHNLESLRGRGDLTGGSLPGRGRPAGCGDPAGRGWRGPCCGC